eukprot:5400847-Prorocentrum_lima.AAC.1
MGRGWGGVRPETTMTATHPSLVAALCGSLDGKASEALRHAHIRAAQHVQSLGPTQPPPTPTPP